MMKAGMPVIRVTAAKWWIRNESSTMNKYASEEFVEWMNNHSR